MPHDLSAQWQADTSNFPGPPSVRDAAFAELLTRYGEPHRAYHATSHLQALFPLLQEHTPVPPSLANRLAIWWHDAIYDPQSGDNEARSAELARAHLGAIGADPTLIDQVETLILATKNHWQGPSLGEGDAFLDADIAILGAPEPVYDRYAAAVRHEFAFAPDPLFRAGRMQFLHHALSQPRLFRTNAFATAFEAPARRNLRRELDGLSAGA
jgi:predicted metal-dependent HD superfamily phosphohydrolase